MPPGSMQPVLTPHDRGRLIGDYYGEEVHLDGAVWRINDPAKSMSPSTGPSSASPTAA
jgi:hypothetical protein